MKKKKKDLLVAFKNESELEFTDISSEKFRMYIWDNQDHEGIAIKIKNPLLLGGSDIGGHRIFDKKGISHYIAPGWIHLMWKTKKGKPNFVK